MAASSLSVCAKPVEKDEDVLIAESGISDSENRRELNLILVKLKLPIVI